MPLSYLTYQVLLCAVVYICRLLVCTKTPGRRTFAMILNIGPPSPDVEYGAHISTLFKQHGEGTQIFLSPSATYDIQTPISLSHDSQQLATLGYPADHTRAVIRTRGVSACGITAAGLSHITLRNLSGSGQLLKQQHVLIFCAFSRRWMRARTW